MDATEASEVAIISLCTVEPKTDSFVMLHFKGVRSATSLCLLWGCTGVHFVHDRKTSINGTILYIFFCRYRLEQRPDALLR